MLSLAEMEALSPVPPGSPCDSSASEEQGRRKAAAAELAAQDAERLAETKRALGSVTPSPLASPASPPGPVSVSAPPSPDSAPLCLPAPGRATAAPPAEPAAGPDVPEKDRYKAIVNGIIKARCLKGRGAWNAARRMVKEEGLFVIAPAVAAKAKVEKKVEKKDENPPPDTGPAKKADPAKGGGGAKKK